MPPDFFVKQRLHSGAPVHIGSAAIEMSDADLQQHVRADPCDMLFVDVQHAPYTEPQLVACCAAATRAGAPVLLRLRHPRLVCQISSVLDFGAAGVLIPLTEEPETVREAIEAFYYPPFGNRSVGPRFAFQYGAFTDYREYCAWWNEHGILALQIETVRGVEQVRQLALPGVDLLLFGASDLSMSLAAHPECPWRTVADCQQHVLAETRDLDVRVGVADLPFGRFES